MTDVLDLQIEGMQTRYLSAADIEASQETRMLRVSFSSAKPVPRHVYCEDLPDGASSYFDEILPSDSKYWDLSRVRDDVCPFLKNHDRHSKLGQVKSVTFDNDLGYATVKLRKTKDVDDFLSDVANETAGGISFGYMVRKYRVISPAEYDGDGWDRKLSKRAVLEGIDILLFEVSSEEIPADSSVGFGKGLSLKSMSIEGDPGFMHQRTDHADLKTGDFVEWAASGGKAQGKIQKKATSGTVKPEPDGNEMEGTTDEPAFLIANYTKSGDRWKPSGVKTAHRAGMLTKIEPLKTQGKNMSDEKEWNSEEVANLRSLITNAESKVVSLARETQEKDAEIASLRMQISPLKTELKASEERYSNLAATVQAMERQQEVGDRYNELRRTAEGLLSESKLSASEFQKLFRGEAPADIQRFVKSESGDQDLSKIAFFLEMSGDRAPQLNLKSHLKDEPLTTDSNQPSEAEIQAKAEKMLAATQFQRVVI